MNRLILLAGMILSTATAANAAQPSDQNAISAGHALSLEFCASCHVVAADQPKPPLYANAPPSFAAIANRGTTTTASLRRFVRTTHPTIAAPLKMPGVQVTDDQLDQIVAYIISLRHSH